MCTFLTSSGLSRGPPDQYHPKIQELSLNAYTPRQYLGGLKTSLLLAKLQDHLMPGFSVHVPNPHPLTLELANNS